MERHEMLAQLRALKLHGMVAAFDEVIDEGIKRFAERCEPESEVDKFRVFQTDVLFEMSDIAL